MGLDKVKKGLENDLDNQRSVLLQEAEERKKELMDKAKAEIKEYRERKNEELETRTSSLERSEVASEKLQVKKKLLNAKKEAIDDSFDKAMEELVSMTPKKRESVLKSLIKLAEKEIDVDKVYCSSKDEKLVKGHKAEAADDIRGGVVCEDKSGKERVDLTYEILLSEIRDRNLKEVAEILF